MFCGRRLENVMYAPRTVGNKLHASDLHQLIRVNTLLMLCSMLSRSDSIKYQRYQIAYNTESS